MEIKPSQGKASENGHEKKKCICMEVYFEATQNSGGQTEQSNCDMTVHKNSDDLYVTLLM